MTQFFQQPGAITIAPDFTGIALDRVPAGYYRIGFNPDIGQFYLANVDPLQVADKIYGNLLKHLPRIEEAFANQTDKPLSILLEGLKGSGKSLLMKTLAKRFVENEDGIVLMCNTAFTGDDYFEFLQKITQKKIVLMDEFDKVYKEKEDRNKILTLLDGNFASHTMFILTMNSNLSSGNFEFFHNRPGRVMFNIKFKGVPLDVIEAYTREHLNDLNKLSDVMQLVKRFTDFNMDMLSKLINEINHCSELTVEEITEYLNVKPDLTLDDVYLSGQYFRNGVDVTKYITCGTSDRSLKSFLICIDKPGHSAHLNFSLSNAKQFNETTGKPITESKLTADDRAVSGVNVHVGKGLKKFVEYFDEYIYSEDATREQDPSTGVIKNTSKTSEGDAEWVVLLTPEVIKRYSFSF